MYTNESISKVMDLARARAAELSNIPVDDIQMCISHGNRKIGRVMNVSLMPVMTYGNCKECKYLCYDIKACLQYPNTVIDARMRNTVIMRRDRNEYFRRIDDAVSHRRSNKMFRWHVAGDIIDVDYFDRMVKIARKRPDFVFWTYTKMYNVVNEWCSWHIDKRAAVPSNLHVMFSEWRGMPMHNPYGFPEFRVVFKTDSIKPAGHYCPGNCDVCKAAGRGCIVGESTYCNEH